MATSRLPLDIKSFLIESIDSVAHLEVLLMLFADPNKEWTPEAVSKESRSNMTAATLQLESLVRNGLFKHTDSKKYKFQPINPEMHDLVKRLVGFYHDSPVAVVSCIYEKPVDKLKGFADAFKLKKD